MIRLSGMDYMNIFGYTGRLGFTNSNFGKTNTYYSNYGMGLSKRNTSGTYSTALTNSQKTLSTVGNEASALVKSANKLAGDASYKNVEAFVENYNDTVAALSKTVNSTVRSSGNSMQRMTGIMKNNLSEIGITVASDGKMSVDEEKFNNADTGTVNNVFRGNNSYSKVIASSAERLQYAVNSQQQVYTGSVYGRNGLNYNYSNLSLLSALGYNSFNAFF